MSGTTNCSRRCCGTTTGPGRRSGRRRDRRLPPGHRDRGTARAGLRALARRRRPRTLDGGYRRTRRGRHDVRHHRPRRERHVARTALRGRLADDEPDHRPGGAGSLRRRTGAWSVRPLPARAPVRAVGRRHADGGRRHLPRTARSAGVARRAARAGAVHAAAHRRAERHAPRGARARARRSARGELPERVVGRGDRVDAGTTGGTGRLVHVVRDGGDDGEERRHGVERRRRVDGAEHRGRSGGGDDRRGRVAEHDDVRPGRDAVPNEPLGTGRVSPHRDEHDEVAAVEVGDLLPQALPGCRTDPDVRTDLRELGAELHGDGVRAAFPEHEHPSGTDDPAGEPDAVGPGERGERGVEVARLHGPLVDVRGVLRGPRQPAAPRGHELLPDLGGVLETEGADQARDRRLRRAGLGRELGGRADEQQLGVVPDHRGDPALRGRQAVPDGVDAGAHVGDGAHAGTSRPSATTSSAIRSTATASASRPSATSSSETNSSGWWLMPSGLRRNSIATSVTRPSDMASCPARENSSAGAVSPVEAMPARIASISRGAQNTAGARCTSVGDTATPRRVAISSNAAVIASHTRSRPSSNSPRRSTLKRASPGTTFTAPGSTDIVPTVPTCCSARQMRSTARAASAAASRASCRRSYGVPPACRASPTASTVKRRALAMLVTTPRACPACSRWGPCSMCASRYPTSRSGASAASPTRSGSSPKSVKACRRVVPSPSSRSHHASSQTPATAEDPSRALPNRVPSSSENAVTCRATGSGPAAVTRAAVRIAIRTPTTPS
ncbi:hypothetical protein Cus16_2979 [Curtobacterium sp. ER1/6]|nr:hypothetical protein Cus16_2979 [Curtobacterium sp. ER1/6]